MLFRSEVGGCSGFQYELSYQNERNNDLVLNEIILTDEISSKLIKDITLDFINELGYSEFKITNPNAKKGCGCGNSFT